MRAAHAQESRTRTRPRSLEECPGQDRRVDTQVTLANSHCFQYRLQWQGMLLTGQSSPGGLRHQNSNLASQPRRAVRGFVFDSVFNITSFLLPSRSLAIPSIRHHLRHNAPSPQSQHIFEKAFITKHLRSSSSPHSSRRVHHERLMKRLLNLPLVPLCLRAFYFIRDHDNGNHSPTYDHCI